MTPTCPPTTQAEPTVTTTEMHTGGEAVRIVESGFPVPQGDTILDKIADLRSNYDHYRKFVIFEPHGHFDMYAALLVPPDHPEADIAAIFLHNEGYSTMCGHACIALARYAVDRGLVKRPITLPETAVNIQAPCGLIRAQVSVEGATQTGRARFESVPAFVVSTDVKVHVKGHGAVKVDVSYGGAFYAFVEVGDLGLEFGGYPLTEIRAAAAAVTAAVREVVPLSHPTTPAFLYGTIVVDSRTRPPSDVSTNICFFADSETDRSPCGSGVTAWVALMFHRGHLALGQRHTFKNGVTDSEFVGRPVRESQVDDKAAIIVEVEGQGYYTGQSVLTVEQGDRLGRGFLVR